MNKPNTDTVAMQADCEEPCKPSGTPVALQARIDRIRASTARHQLDASGHWIEILTHDLASTSQVCEDERALREDREQQLHRIAEQLSLHCHTDLVSLTELPIAIGSHLKRIMDALKEARMILSLIAQKDCWVNELLVNPSRMDQVSMRELAELTVNDIENRVPALWPGKQKLLAAVDRLKAAQQHRQEDQPAPASTITPSTNG